MFIMVKTNQLVGLEILCIFLIHQDRAFTPFFLTSQAIAFNLHNFQLEPRNQPIATI